MNRRAVAVVAVLVTIAAVGVGLVWQPWSAGLPEGAAFAVGDDVVTEDELDERNETLRALYGIEAPPGGEQLADFRRQSAKSMAINIVLERAFEDHDIEVPENEVDAAMAAFLDQSFSGDREAFVAALGNVGTSEATVREELRHQLRLRALLESVVGPVEVSQQELEAAFEERGDQLATPERRSVSNIVVRTRGEAVRVRDRLEAGEDIGQLARRFSIDASTRNRAGALGKVRRDEMVPAVGKEVFAAPADGIYGPVEGPYGWNVGLVTQVLQPVPARLDRVEQELRAMLELEETQEQWAAWLEERLRDAGIEYAEAYRPPAPYEITSWGEELTGDPLTGAP